MRRFENAWLWNSHRERILFLEWKYEVEKVKVFFRKQGENIRWSKNWALKNWTQKKQGDQQKQLLLRLTNHTNWTSNEHKICDQ